MSNKDNAGQARLPKINPAVFDALNTLDTFVSRAHLTRQEHGVALQQIQKLTRHCESLEQEVEALKYAHAALVKQMNEASVVPRPVNSEELGQH